MSDDRLIHPETTDAAIDPSDTGGGGSSISLGSTEEEAAITEPEAIDPGDTGGGGQ